MAGSKLQEQLTGVYSEDDVEALGEIMSLLQTLEQSEARAEEITLGIEGEIRKAADNLFSAFGKAQHTKARSNTKAPAAAPAASSSAAPPEPTSTGGGATSVSASFVYAAYEAPAYEKQVTAGSRLTLRAQQTREKIAKMRAANPKGCTFAPKINRAFRFKSNATRDLAAERGDAFERLFSGSKDLARRLKSACEAGATRGCTFVPKISKRSQQLGAQRRATTAAAASASGVAAGGSSSSSALPSHTQQTFLSLYEDARNREAKLAEMQKAADDTLVEKFGLDGTAKSGGGGGEIGEGADADADGFAHQQKHIGLIHEGKEVKDARLRELSERKARAELAGCTFAPNVARKAKAQAKWRAAAARATRAAKREKEAGAGGSGSCVPPPPPPPPRSASQGQACARLYADAGASRARQKLAREAAEAEAAARFSFAPETRRSLSSKRKAGNKKSNATGVEPAYERLYRGRAGAKNSGGSGGSPETRAERAARVKRAQAAADTEAGHTFKPSLSRRSLQMAKRRGNKAVATNGTNGGGNRGGGGGGGGSSWDRLYRLHAERAAARKARAAAAEEARYAAEGCTHAPTLSDRSRKLNRRKMGEGATATGRAGGGGGSSGGGVQAANRVFERLYTSASRRGHRNSNVVAAAKGQPAVHMIRPETAAP